MEEVPEYLKPEYYFSAENLEKYKEIFDGINFVWEALPRIAEFIQKRTAEAGEKVIIGEGTKIWDKATIDGPCIIGKNCQIRPGAYIRENVIIGDNCVFRGEAKNSLMMDNSAGAHWPYMGDSLVGSNVNLGAGTKFSNLKSDPSNIVIKIEGERYDTNLTKLGAIIGDKCSTGCDFHTNPGTLIGPRVITYSKAIVGPGFYKGNQIIKYKPKMEIVEIVERK